MQLLWERVETQSEKPCGAGSDKASLTSFYSTPYYSIKNGVVVAFVIILVLFPTSGRCIIYYVFFIFILGVGFAYVIRRARREG